MINLTRLNGTRFWLNAELIETIETTPDVVISLTTGRKYVVKESAEDVVAAVLVYRNRPLLATREGESGGL